MESRIAPATLRLLREFLPLGPVAEQVEDRWQPGACSVAVMFQFGLRESNLINIMTRRLPK